MINNLIVFGENEAIVKEIKGKKIYATITTQRVVISSEDYTFSILNETIGTIQFYKNGGKYSLRLYTKDGADMFPFAKNRRLEYFREDEAREFESALSSVLLVK